MVPTEIFYVLIIFTHVGNSGPKPYNPCGHFVIENGNFYEKIANFWQKYWLTKKNFFGAFLVVPICRNIFVKAQFLKIFLKIGRLSIQFYSLAKGLCSFEYWLVEKPLGNSNAVRTTCFCNNQIILTTWLGNCIETFNTSSYFAKSSPPFPKGQKIVFLLKKPDLGPKKIGYGFGGYPPPRLQKKIPAKRGLRIWGVPSPPLRTFPRKMFFKKC